MSLTEALRQGAIGLGCTLALALTGSVVTATRQNAVQDEQLGNLQLHIRETDETLQKLNANVQQLHEDVAVLNERLRDGSR